MREFLDKARSGSSGKFLLAFFLYKDATLKNRTYSHKPKCQKGQRGLIFQKFPCFSSQAITGEEKHGNLGKGLNMNLSSVPSLKGASHTDMAGPSLKDDDQASHSAANLV